jgi:hypothetical protein
LVRRGRDTHLALGLGLLWLNLLLLLDLLLGLLCGSSLDLLNNEEGKSERISPKTVRKHRLTASARISLEDLGTLAAETFLVSFEDFFSVDLAIIK